MGNTSKTKNIESLNFTHAAAKNKKSLLSTLVTCMLF